MGEWLNLVAWNAAVGQPTVSSNLTLSTTFHNSNQLLLPPIQQLNATQLFFNTSLTFMEYNISLISFGTAPLVSKGDKTSKIK